MIDTPQSLTKELYQKNLELLYERKRMEQLLYSVSEAILAVDKDYKVTIFNHKAEILTGKSFTLTVGRDISEVLEMFDETNEVFDVKAACFTPQPTTISVLSMMNNGKKNFFYFKSITVESDDRPAECLITLTDITNEKQLEQAKDDFISVASHELRTPMTIIKSYLWMLTAGKGGPINTKQYEYLLKATNATERMINLINDTLSISRLEQGRVEYTIEKINLVDVVNDYLTDLSVKAQEREIFLKMETDKKEAMVYADKSKTGEILVNLIGNALKFTKKGGITISFTEDNDFVKTNIIDSGAGISEEDQKNLFLKFSRLDNSYQTVAETGGTGLGLYIVKLYVEGMGGKVGVFSEGVNKGSTFWFTFPKSKQPTKEILSTS